VTAVLRGVARGLKVSYLTLTGDLRQANYSSMRAGLLPERDHWRSLQVWFATHFHRVTYRDWVDMAALKRAIAVDARLGSDYYDVAWRGRGWKWVDPKNELEAARRKYS
jgi:capsid protein